MINNSIATVIEKNLPNIPLLHAKAQTRLYKHGYYYRIFVSRPGTSDTYWAVTSLSTINKL